MVSLLQQPRLGVLAQTYYPADSSITAWNTIIEAKNTYPDCPIAVVINDIAKDEILIKRLRDTGIIVLGWVDTNYATIPEEDVRKAIDAWHSFYPDMDGIFFQSMSNQTTDQAYYDNLHNYTRFTVGFSTTCGNAKTTVPTGFLNGGTTDVVIVWDGSGLDVVDSTYSQYNIMENNTLGVSAFAAPTLNTAWISQMGQYVGWVYMTSDSDTIPYDSLPSYFTQMVEHIASLGAITSPSPPSPSSRATTPMARSSHHTDPYGVNKIYHTKVGGEEFFTNQNDLLADASTNGRIQNFEGENITKQSDGSYQSNGGSNGDLRIEIWSREFSTLSERQAAAWLNVEVTIYTKYMSQDGRNPNYLCQLYGKGGHHSSNAHCEGAAYKFRLNRTQNETSYDKEICHASYAGNSNRVSVSGLSGGFGNGIWHGFKAIQWTEGNNVRLKTWVDTNCSDSSGNLVVHNNWRQVNERVDSGGWAADSRFSTDCSGCGRSASTEIMTGKYTVTSSGDANHGQNLCAYRTDGVTTRFRYFSAREIDPALLVSDTPEEPQNPDTATSDPFGVKKIYPTATNGFQFFLPTAAATDTTNWVPIPSAGITTNSDGSYKMSTASTPSDVHGTQTRLNVFQRNGYSGTTAQTNAQNHAQLHSQGWMQDANDWRNIEMTGYFRVNTAPTTGNIEFTARGGRHLDPSPNAEGTALRAHLSSTGNLQFLKEQYHSSIVSEPAVNVTTSIVGRWVGLKYVVANKTIAGTLVTKQEFWLDNAANNTWTKVGEKVDAGGWGAAGGQYGAAADQLISWGGPACIFWWTSFTNVDFKWISVRELDPAGIPIEAPPPDNPSHCGTSA